MPVYLRCPICGFEREHGFLLLVGGITGFSHFIPGCEPQWVMECSHYWYEFKGKTYRTKKEAWKEARKQYPKDTWRDAWDARLIEQNEKKAQRLFAEWREEVEAGLAEDTEPTREEIAAFKKAVGILRETHFPTTSVLYRPIEYTRLMLEKGVEYAGVSSLGECALGERRAPSRKELEAVKKAYDVLAKMRFVSWLSPRAEYAKRRLWWILSHFGVI